MSFSGFASPYSNALPNLQDKSAVISFAKNVGIHHQSPLMFQVKATDAQRRFGQILRDAQREPLEILSHGKPAAVLISPHEYARLKALDRQVVLAGSFDEGTVRLLQSVEAPAQAAEFDHEVE